MITSVANQQVKQIIQLRTKAKARNTKRVFLIEGIKMLLEAPKERVEKVYASKSFWEEASGREALEGFDTEVVEDSVFSHMADTVTPQGVLAVVRQFSYSLDELLQKENPLFLVLETLQDPGNLGTIMRTAEGAGVTGIILNRTSVDIYNPKTIRSTMGSIYRVPFLYADDLQEVLKKFASCRIRTYAAHLSESVDYDRADYTGGTAFFIGNEGNGLSDELASLADQYIKIPMEGRLESLNAAMAAGILMYEAYRQRRK